MTKYTTEDGSVVEAFSQAEMDAKIAQAVSAKDEEIKKISEKAANLEKAHQGAEVDKKKAEEAMTALQNQVTDLTGVVKGNTKKELLAKLSNGDADMEKKIEHEYSQFGGDPVDKAGIEERMLKSYRLANPKVAPSTMSEALSYASAGGTGAAPRGETTGIVDTTKEMGKKMGLSEEDYKKYGDKIPVTNEEK